MALVGLGYGSTGAETDGPWLAREIIDKVGPPYDHNTMQTDIEMTDAKGNSHNLLGAATVQAADYQGATPNAPIMIGNLTSNLISATPTILAMAGSYGDATGANRMTLGGATGAQFLSGSEMQPSADLKLVPGTASLSYDSTNPTALTLNSDGAALTTDKAITQTVNGPSGATTQSSVTDQLITEYSNDINIEAGDSNTGILPFGNPALNPTTNITALSAKKGGVGTVNIESTAINLTATDRGGAPAGQSNIALYSNGNFRYFTYYNNAYNPIISAEPVDTACLSKKGYDGSPEQLILGATQDGTCNLWKTEPVDLDVTGYIEDANGSIGKISSDRRLKKDIKPLINSLQNIERLNGYSFKWKRNGVADVGVIAQEVETVFPQLVDINRITGMKEVAYGNLVAPLIEAVKTLHHLLNEAAATFTQQIATLQQDDHTLQAQVQTLTEQNRTLSTELAQQHLDLVELKYVLHQPLSAADRTLCGAACAP